MSGYKTLDLRLFSMIELLLSTAWSSYLDLDTGSVSCSLHLQTRPEQLLVATRKNPSSRAVVYSWKRRQYLPPLPTTAQKSNDVNSQARSHTTVYVNLNARAVSGSSPVTRKRKQLARASKHSP
eukprot:3084705-Pleurochrysis_carterae.AAC.4